VAAIEVLSARERVRRPVVGVGDGPEDQIDLVHKLRAPEREMKPGSGIEDDASAFWICGAPVVLVHAEKLRVAPDGVASRTPRTIALSVADRRVPSQCSGEHPEWRVSQAQLIETRDPFRVVVDGYFSKPA
jgi:hypothetical protein